LTEQTRQRTRSLILALRFVVVSSHSIFSHNLYLSKVTPYSPIYFYQFNSPAANNSVWTGRFTITDNVNDIVPAAQSTQPDGEAIPWGVGQLVNGNSTTSAPASTTSLASPTTALDTPLTTSSVSITSYIASAREQDNPPLFRVMLPPARLRPRRRPLLHKLELAAASPSPHKASVGRLL
jgi:hypothetical protein